MTLTHLSDTPGIRVFIPRPVRHRPPRTPGQEWLNGPLVWAIDHWHRPLYLFPRECPRILMWRRPESTAMDIHRYRVPSHARMVAYIEATWMERLQTATLTEYTLPPDSFIDLRDAGMHVSQETLRPLHQSTLTQLPTHLAAAQVELRPVTSLAALRPAWDSTLHVSGIRLRNAASWP